LYSEAGAFAGGGSFCAHDANTKKNNAKTTSVVLFDTSRFGNLFFNATSGSEERLKHLTILHDRGNVHEKVAG
jgi:hypothetical protein